MNRHESRVKLSKMNPGTIITFKTERSEWRIVVSNDSKLESDYVSKLTITSNSPSFHFDPSTQNNFYGLDLIVEHGAWVYQVGGSDPRVMQTGKILPGSIEVDEP